VPVTWDPSYETGNVGIDLQHRELLAVVDELESTEATVHSTRDVILGVLTHVMDFTNTHFIMEEDLMTEVDYPTPACDQMIAQHREFTSYARLRVLEFRTGGMASVIPFQVFLVGWLTTHEFGLDKLLADFIRSRELEGFGDARGLSPR